MIIDLKTLNDRRDLRKVFNEARRAAVRMDAVNNRAIRFYDPQPINVIRYFTDTRFLFNRISSIANISKIQVKADGRKEKVSALIWSIMSVFGHTPQEINPVFGLASSTRGQIQYYRAKLQQQMRTDPNVVFLYEKIMNILEKDMEEFE